MLELLEEVLEMGGAPSFGRKEAEALLDVRNRKGFVAFDEKGKRWKLTEAGHVERERIRALPSSEV